MDKKINLDEIFEKQNPQDGKLPECAKNFALESIRQVLELAAENAITTWQHCSHASGNYCDCEAEVDEQSILNTINQIK